ncbi:MAG: type III secretion system stator protein SctL [Bdellovibrionales bacterium]|nr:type III secretion system stator protein SctL [Bdellovibrionales bacterium]
MATEKKDSASPKLAAALSEAQSILEAAEKRAQMLTADAERTFSEAYDKGYSEGLKQGRDDAVEQAVRLIEDSTRVHDVLAEEAARLAIAIAGSVVGEHVAVQPEAAKRIAAAALQEAVVGDSVVIVVHPLDEPALGEAADQLRRVAGGARVKIETDEKFTRGGCIVRTEFGEVDATIEALVESIGERIGVHRNGR